MGDDHEGFFHEGPYPTRRTMSNEADIIAALSALRKGSAAAVETGGNSWTWQQVKKYMQLLKESAVAQLQTGTYTASRQTFEATEFLDDGHRIQVQYFNFSGKTGF